MKQYQQLETTSNREQLKVSEIESKSKNQSQTQDICFEVRATALLPAFIAVKGFHYPWAPYNGLPKTGAPNSTTYKNLYRRGNFHKNKKKL